MAFLSFPSNFLWGSATSAYQVEGQNFNNDWWDWEQTPGHIRNNDSSRMACDWRGGRYHEDLQRAQALGHNTHRLSVEWSRIEPSEGQWDANALQFYRDVLKELRQRGMVPLVDLHHFTNPRWLATKGGWKNPATVEYFARYARTVVRELGDLCTFWITFNEPNAYAYQCYAAGAWPPQDQDLRTALAALAVMVRAHAAAYHSIKMVQPEAQVGVAHYYRVFLPHRHSSPLDHLVARLRDYIFNRLFLLALQDGRLYFPLTLGKSVPEARGTQDFIGLNYYYGEQVKFDVTAAAQLFGRSILQPWALRWKETFGGIGNIEPQGLEQTLKELARFRLPIYITENGIFDMQDGVQSRYLVSHLAAAQRAIQGGVPVKGYYWWTLVDNFELAEGYAPRFGLYHLDLETQARTPRPIASVYARIIRERGISDDLMELYGHLS
jgi:beta-glucosidase